MRYGQEMVLLLYLYLASAGISSSSSLLSALKIAVTGFGRDTGGSVAGWGRAVFNDILMPKPFPDGLVMGVGFTGDIGGLGEGEGFEGATTRVGAGTWWCT